jgi:Yip1 domain
MDINKLIERVKNILLTPKTEWPVIAAEQTDTTRLYTGYALILAAIPAVFGLLSTLLFAPSTIILGFIIMLVRYVLGLGLVFALGFIIDLLAPTFGAQKNALQAQKTAVYANTPSWVAGVFAIVPVLGWLIALAAMVYSLIQLFIALPHTMKAPAEKAGGYFAVVLAVYVALFLLVWGVLAVVGIIFAFAGAAIAS